jgi:hypothetical protein
MEKTLTLTPGEIQALEWMIRLAELRIEELQKKDNKLERIISDAYKNHVISISNKLL